MSLLDEDLVASDDSDFSDLFPEAGNKSNPNLDDELTTVEETDVFDDEVPVKKETHKKRGGRPAKATKKATAVECDTEVPVKKKRGRPAKKSIEDVVDESQSEHQDQKKHTKRVSVDDFDPDILNEIFENYSQKPVSEIEKTIGIPEKYIHKAISRMKELFEMAISTGDLTQEDYDELISPKLEEYIEPKDAIEVFVKKTVKEIVK